MRKRRTAGLLLLIFLLAMSGGCRLDQTEESDRQESIQTEESQTEKPEKSQPESRQESQQESEPEEIVIPEGWTGPEIIYSRVASDWSDSEDEQRKLATWVLGQRLLQSRFAEGALEKYGYQITAQNNYRISSAVMTTSVWYEEGRTLYAPGVIADDETWIASYRCQVKFKGVMPDGTKGNEDEDTEYRWNLGSERWVIHNADGVYAMMTYEDYSRALKKGSADPFAENAVDPAEVPVTDRYWGYQRENLDPPEGAYYLEELDVWVKKGTRLYTYTAAPDEAMETIALKLGIQWLEDLCATPYEEGMDKSYLVREYKEPRLVALFRSKEAPDQYSCGPIKASDTIWVAEVQALLKGAGDYTIVAADEWKDTWIEFPQFFGNYKEIIRKDGSEYTMLLSSSLLTSFPLYGFYEETRDSWKIR